MIHVFRSLKMFALWCLVAAFGCLSGCGANLFGATQPNDLAQTADEIGPQMAINNSGTAFIILPGPANADGTPNVINLPALERMADTITNTGQSETNGTNSQHGSSEQSGTQTGGDPTSQNEGSVDLPGG